MVRKKLNGIGARGDPAKNNPEPNLTTPLKEGCEF